MVRFGLYLPPGTGWFMFGITMTWAIILSGSMLVNKYAIIPNFPTVEIKW